MSKVEFGTTLGRALAEGKASEFDAPAWAASPELVLPTFFDGEMQGREAVLEVMKRTLAEGMYSRII